MIEYYRCERKKLKDETIYYLKKVTSRKHRTTKVLNKLMAESYIEDFD